MQVVPMSSLSGKSGEQGSAGVKRGGVASATGYPLVSVGIPVFNGERFVSESIQSILDQDYPNLEVIISDNGSTDSTPEILHGFSERDDRIRLFTHAENRGAAWNFNFVFSRSQGGLFKWATHDDVCAPSFIRECVSALESRPDAVLAYPRASVIDGHGSVIRDYENHGFGCAADRLERVRSMLRRESGCFEVCGVIRREALTATRMLGRYAGADRVLLFELGVVGPFIEVEKRLFFYRRHEAQSVSKHRNPRERSRWFDSEAREGGVFPYWRVLREHIGAIHRHWPREGRIRAYFLLLHWLRNHSRALTREVARGAWAIVRRKT